jgi:hypothetical protein
VSERHVCTVLEIGRTTYHYEGRKEQWTELRMRMREIAQTLKQRAHVRLHKPAVLVSETHFNPLSAT